MPTLSSYNLNTYQGNTVKGEVTWGMGYGAMLGVNFNKHVALQLEGIYNSYSQKYSDREVQSKITLDYVNVPLLLSFNTDRTKGVNLNVAIGPQAGINVGSKISTTGTNESDTTRAVLVAKKGDLGFAYGAGLEFALNPSHTFHLNLGFRGVYGFDRYQR